MALMPPTGKTTKIDGHDVPFEAGELVTAEFAASPKFLTGAGLWEYWAIYNDKDGRVARCRQGTDPGQRFRDMETTPVEQDDWAVARMGKAIRPATMAEVIGWLGKKHETPQLRSLNVSSYAPAI